MMKREQLKECLYERRSGKASGKGDEDGVFDVVDRSVGMERKRKGVKVFVEFVREIVEGDADAVFSNLYLYIDGKKGVADLDRFLRGRGRLRLFRRICRDPLGVWTYDEDGAVWFDETVKGTTVRVLLRGAMTGDGEVIEVGLLLGFVE